MHLSASLLTWLRCFEAAARCGSFTRAAEELHLTQSAVSQQIRLLEQRLACKLFYRLPGRLELSRRGRTLYGELKPALRQITRALETFRAPEGPIYVSCSPSFATRWLVPRIGEFLRLHSEIGLHLRAEFHALNRERFVLEGLHVAIRYDPTDYTDLNAKTLLREYLLPVASPAFLDRHPQLSTQFDLRDITLLHDSEPWDGAPENAEWQTIMSAVGSTGGTHRNCFFNLADLSMASARSGEGVAAARLALVLDDLEAKQLVPVLERPVPTTSRYVVLSIDEEDGRVEAFTKWLFEEAALFEARRQSIFKTAETGPRLRRIGAPVD